MKRTKRTVDEIRKDIESNSKVCKRCFERRDFRFFKRSAQNPDGRCNICKYCTRKVRFTEQILDDIESNSKVCFDCKQRKDFYEFYEEKRGTDGRRHICIPCVAKRKQINNDRAQTVTRRGMVLLKYGIDEYQLMNLMDKQRGCCCICKESLVSPNSKQTFHIDHNHSTDTVRGLLCGGCNSMLGQSKDSPSILMAGYNYLIKNGYYGEH